VFSRPLDRTCGVACRQEVEKVFEVVKTGKDPDHYTVILPNPMTKEATDAFNELFKIPP
jgi:hypothetical protein